MDILSSLSLLSQLSDRVNGGPLTSSGMAQKLTHFFAEASDVIEDPGDEYSSGNLFSSDSSRICGVAELTE